MPGFISVAIVERQFSLEAASLIYTGYFLTYCICLDYRFDKRDCHQALPYYKMSGLSVTEVIQRNVATANSPPDYGKGFIFFLRHSLYEEDMEELSQVCEEASNATLNRGCIGSICPSQNASSFIIKLLALL